MQAKKHQMNKMEETKTHENKEPRSFSNKKEVIERTDKFNREHVHHKVRDGYSKSRIVELGETKLRRKLDNWYSKTGYNASSNQGRFSSQTNLENVKCERSVHKPPLSNTPSNKKILSNTSLLKYTEGKNNRFDLINTIKTDGVSSNLCSLIQRDNIELTRK